MKCAKAPGATPVAQTATNTASARRETSDGALRGFQQSAATSAAVTQLQALQRAADGAAVVQRYTTIKGDPDKRMSGGKKIVRTGPKTVFADESLITEANSKLEDTASYVRLSADSSREYATDDSGDTLPMVKLNWNARIDDRSFMDAASVANEEGGFKSFADCHRTAQAVMGSTQTEGVDTEKPVRRNSKGAETIEPTSKREVRRGVNVRGDAANRGAYAVLGDALPKVKAAVHGMGEVIGDALNTAVPDGGGPISGKPFKQWAAYAAIYADPWRRDLFSKFSGSNEFATPEVGEALTIVSGFMAKDAFKNRATYDDLVARIGQQDVDDLHITADDSFDQMWRKLGDAGDAQREKLAKTHMLAKLNANAAVLEGLSVSGTILDELRGDTALEAIVSRLSREDFLALYKSGAIDMGQTATAKADASIDHVPPDIVAASGAIAAGARDASTATVRQPWNFHWAGVILKDGGDYVTLENLSVEDPGTLNENWFFQMFGTEQKDQTFHAQYAETGEFGNVPLTINYSNHPET